MPNDSTDDQQAEEDFENEGILTYLKGVGFKGCPLCGNKQSFTTGQRATVGDLGTVKMQSWLPGTSTIPGDTSGKKTPFQTHLYTIICNNCSFVMPFSQVHMQYQIEKKKNGG